MDDNKLFFTKNSQIGFEEVSHCQLRTLCRDCQRPLFFLATHWSSLFFGRQVTYSQSPDTTCFPFLNSVGHNFASWMIPFRPNFKASSRLKILESRLAHPRTCAKIKVTNNLYILNLKLTTGAQNVFTLCDSNQSWNFVRIQNGFEFLNAL